VKAGKLTRERLCGLQVYSGVIGRDWGASTAASATLLAAAGGLFSLFGLRVMMQPQGMIAIKPITMIHSAIFVSMPHLFCRARLGSGRAGALSLVARPSAEKC
jgi:hypothetical protein